METSPYPKIPTLRVMCLAALSLMAWMKQRAVPRREVTTGKLVILTSSSLADELLVQRLPSSCLLMTIRAAQHFGSGMRPFTYP